MNYFWAFVTGGAICVVGQLFLDLTPLTPARILTGYVVAGVVLSALGWYAPLAEFAGWAFWALAEQPAPLPPEQLLEKQKPPYRVPDTEVLFVSRSLDLS